MDVERLRGTLHDSEAGKITFSQVIGVLSGAGVESYFVDLAKGTDTFYMSSGGTHTEALTLPLTGVAQTFSLVDLIAAIRGAQVDEIRYPEFLKRAAAAGVSAYWAFLSGRRVIYFGRKGDFHIEKFPDAES